MKIVGLDVGRVVNPTVHTLTHSRLYFHIRDAEFAEFFTGFSQRSLRLGGEKKICQSISWTASVPASSQGTEACFLEMCSLQVTHTISTAGQISALAPYY